MLRDISEAQLKGELKVIGVDVGRQCWNPECGDADLIVTEVEWEEK